MDQHIFLHKIKEQVLKEDKEASVILYGSRARGDYREDSDWDILVLTSQVIELQSKRKMRDDIYDVELEFMQDVSAIIVDKEKWNSLSITPLYNNVINEGQVV